MNDCRCTNCGRCEHAHEGLLHEWTNEPRATVILFKSSGKYYTEETWRIPNGAIGPYDMINSPDFRRLGGHGPVLVETQEPWGYPHLFPGTGNDDTL